MTRVRRPKQQQQVTLVRLLLFFFSIGFVTLLLFRIDSDFAKKDRKRLGSRPVVLSPELLAGTHPGGQQQQVAQAQRQNGEANNEENESIESIEEKKPESNIAQEREKAGHEVGGDGPKRYKIELANLEGGGTGTVILETRPSWAPIGARHFRELVEDQFYDQCRFFRVLPDFVVQFGINGSPQVQAKWRESVLQDDPVTQSNSRGTITYATSGKNTRATQLFINKKDNKYLDDQGFAPFGLVVEGMQFVDLINDEYKEKPNQGKIQNQGNDYLNREFPNLSYVASIREINPGVAQVVAK